MFQKSPVWQNLLHKRGTSQFFVKSFLTQSTQVLRSGTLLCFSKILVSRIVTDKRQISRLPVIFLFYRNTKFVGDFFLRSRKFRVSIRVRDNRGDITIFRRKYVVSQDREISWRFSFVLLGIFAIRKVYDYEGDGARMEYNDFPSKICCLIGSKNS